MRKDDIKFGNYVVAFLDLLNQKEILASMDALPSNENEERAFTEKLTKTYGKVEAFRNIFDDLDKVCLEALINSPLNDIANLVPELKKLRGRIIKRHCFSDTIVYYSPLMKSPDYLGITNVYSFIASIASLQLLALAGRSVFRGGIDIGIAGEYLENEIYGNALYKAYHLEDKVAQYPRVVVGKYLYGYIYVKSNLPGNDLATNYQRAISKLCFDFIKIDHDNEYVINPVCDQVKRRIGERFNEIHAMALVFVKNEVIRFRNTNQKLYGRYQNLENMLRL